MSKSIQQKMHEQHVKWQHDHDTWLADIDLWKKETQAALSNLAEIDSALRASLDALDSHNNTVWEGQQRLKAHELTLSEEAKAGSNKTDKDWSHSHKQQASQHEKTADAHERIKRHQHKVVAEVTRLLNQVSEAV